MTTTIIRNGLFFDGTGSEGIKKDILIKDGKVAETGTIPQIEDAKEIDATNCWITPGFLDIHTHYDAEVEVMPGLEESIRHGVTTVVFGNCSISSALGSDEEIVDLFARVENMPAKILTEWIKDKITWKNTREYYDHLETLNLGPNVATFIGHSNLRIAAMGLERSLTIPKASKTELQHMENNLREAMEAGYLGMSIDMLPFHRMAGIFEKDFTGISVPSQQAKASEYRYLSKTLRKYSRVLQATPNAVDKSSVVKLIGMSAGGLFRKPLKTTIVAALDVKSDKRIHLLATTLANISNTFLRADIRWQALAEPFLNYSDGAVTPLFEEFPSTVHAIGQSSKDRKALFADDTFRKQLKKEWNHKGTAVFHRKLDDMWVVSSPEKDQKGKSVAELAKANKKEPLEYFMDMIAKYDTDFRWKSEVANHRAKQRMRLLAHHTTIPGFNDSGAHNVNMAYQDGALQTLQQARAFPEIMPLAKTIHRLTKMPADWLGIKTGSLLKGDKADLVVIDPEKLKTNLGEPIEDHDERLKGASRLVKRSDGVIKHTFVGGEEVFNGKTGFSKDLGEKRFGELLRAK